jgi:hypothetical protein
MPTYDSDAGFNVGKGGGNRNGESFEEMRPVGGQSG